jgi:hypothetical protein
MITALLANPRARMGFVALLAVLMLAASAVAAEPVKFA